MCLEKMLRTWPKTLAYFAGIAITLTTLALLFRIING